MTVHQQAHDEAREFHARINAEAHDIAALLGDDPAVALAHVQQARALLDVAETIGVETMRRRGASWTEIGDVYLISKQAAWERFRHTIRADVTPPQGEHLEDDGTTTVS